MRKEAHMCVSTKVPSTCNAWGITPSPPDKRSHVNRCADICCRCGVFLGGNTTHSCPEGLLDVGRRRRPRLSVIGMALTFSVGD